MQLNGLINLNPTDIVTIIIRTSIIYFAVLGGLRIAGKRELGQMAPFDLVVILIISNAVQNAMVGPDTSLTGGLVAAFTLLGVNWVVNRTGLKLSWLGRGMIGTPTVLVNNGEFLEQNLRREGINKEEVMMALREHGVADVEDVDLAVLEVDGTISVVAHNAEGTRSRHRLRGRKPIV
jgi:uncharacterized membrane protein YcaP (DUF421 family)